MTVRKQTSTTENPARHDTQEEEIRLRAYELYEQRGREDGHDTEDWLQAEEELSTQNRKAIAA